MEAELPNLARRAAWSARRMAMYSCSYPTTHLLTRVSLEAMEQLLVARDQPRLDQRGLGLHVAVGNLHAVLDAADRMADLQADVPQRVKEAVDDAGQMRQWAGAGGHLPAVQEHEVNVAVRIQLRAAIPADGHQRQLRELLAGLLGQAGLGGFPQVAQQRVENRGARVADFEAAGAGAMLELEPVRFHLEEGLVTSQFLGGLPPRWQRQSGCGTRLNLLEQFLHCKSL